MIVKSCLQGFFDIKEVNPVRHKKPGKKYIPCLPILAPPPLRVLLAAVSPYFRAMFTSPLVESRLTEIRLEEVTPSVMETVIQFVYSGEAGLSLDTAEDLFVAANRLQVMPLQDLCSRYRNRSQPSCLQSFRFFGSLMADVLPSPPQVPVRAPLGR